MQTGFYLKILIAVRNAVAHSFHFKNGCSMDLIQSRPMCIENPFKNIQANSNSSSSKMMSTDGSDQFSFYYFNICLLKALEKCALTCLFRLKIFYHFLHFSLSLSRPFEIWFFFSLTQGFQELLLGNGQCSFHTFLRLKTNFRGREMKPG